MIFLAFVGDNNFLFLPGDITFLVLAGDNIFIVIGYTVQISCGRFLTEDLLFCFVLFCFGLPFVEIVNGSVVVVLDRTQLICTVGIGSIVTFGDALLDRYE